MWGMLSISIYHMGTSADPLSESTWKRQRRRHIKGQNNRSAVKCKGSQSGWSVKEAYTCSLHYISRGNVCSGLDLWNTSDIASIYRWPVNLNKGLNNVKNNQTIHTCLYFTHRLVQASLCLLLSLVVPLMLFSHSLADPMRKHRNNRFYICITHVGGSLLSTSLKQKRIYWIKRFPLPPLKIYSPLIVITMVWRKHAWPQDCQFNPLV